MTRQQAERASERARERERGGREGGKEGGREAVGAQRRRAVDAMSTGALDLHHHTGEVHMRKLDRRARSRIGEHEL